MLDLELVLKKFLNCSQNLHKLTLWLQETLVAVVLGLQFVRGEVFIALVFLSLITCFVSYLK